MKRTLCIACGCITILLFGQCNSGRSGDVSVSSDQTVEVLVDVAHGGKDHGAVSAIDGTKEKDAVMMFGDAVRTNLAANGVVSVLDRSEDRFVSLDDRVRLANELKPALVVSLHLNASRDSSQQGFSLYYQERSEGSQRLASEIQGELRTLGYLKDNGVKSASFRLLKSISVPTVLVDLAYVTNRADLLALEDSTRRMEIVQRLTRAIMKYRGS